MPEHTLLCLGNFDGVHLAHRKLLQDARAWRDKDLPGLAVGVFCFRELPVDLLLADPPGHLCSARERLERLAECGMEFAVLAEFAELRSLAPQDYVREILIERCHCCAAACGFNHRFGAGASGSPALLQKELNGKLLLADAVTDGGEAVSSTRIRGLLEQGNVEEAARLLKGSYRLRAPVLHGKALGRRIGSPTVNQNFPQNAVIPRFGVYATDCLVEGKHYAGVSNVGIRPTVENKQRANCETYLLDFSGDVYGMEIDVSFLHFIRPEMKFASVEALRAQIAKDVATVRSMPDVPNGACRN